MRLRHVKDADIKLKVNDNPYYIENPKDYKGKWNTLFNNDNPLHVEIGCGKGQFIKELATRNPDINYVAIEKYDSVLIRALEKVLDSNLTNLKLLCIDANNLLEYFGEHEVSRIYLNFSDPWPKSHHKKRRLTSYVFLDQYKVILAPNAEIHQKTDNRKLFEFSLESFNENGWKISNISLNLHEDSEKYPDNIETEFEEKWKVLGPIYRLEAKLK